MRQRLHGLWRWEKDTRLSHSGDSRQRQSMHDKQAPVMPLSLAGDMLAATSRSGGLTHLPKISDLPGFRHET
jgi:hypothetical protein